MNIGIRAFKKIVVQDVFFIRAFLITAGMIRFREQVISLDAVFLKLLNIILVLLTFEPTYSQDDQISHALWGVRMCTWFPSIE